MISEQRGTSSPEEDVSFQNYPHNRRKRDGSICEEDLPPSKRNSFHAVSVKCLIPHQIAGKLLGKGGDKMRKLKEIAPKLFMSKNDEYFPNTDERVLFIGGTLEQVHEVLGEVQAKIIEASQDVNMHSLPPKWRLNQMKLVVANSTCSKIIGNKGEVIKQVREGTDTKITTTPLKHIVGNERLVTLSGSDPNVMEALRQILVLVEEDKDARLQNDVSYKKFSALHTNPYLNTAAVAAEAAVAAAGAAAFAPANHYIQALNGGPQMWAASRPGWDHSLLQNMLGGGMATLGNNPAALAAMANGAAHGIHLNHNPAMPTVDKTKIPQVPIVGGLGAPGMTAAGAAAAAAAGNPLELLGAAAASLGAAAASGNNNVVVNNSTMIECLGGLIAQIARQQRMNNGMFK